MLHSRRNKPDMGQPPTKFQMYLILCIGHEEVNVKFKKCKLMIFFKTINVKNQIFHQMCLLLLFLLPAFHISPKKYVSCSKNSYPKIKILVRQCKTKHDFTLILSSGELC